MPNYMVTRCVVTGPNAEIARFRAVMGDVLEDFDSLIPVPQTLIDRETLLYCSGHSADVAQALVALRSEPVGVTWLPSLFWYEPVRRATGLPRDAAPCEVAAAYLAQRPDVEAAGRVRLQNILDTGFGDVRDWMQINWGARSSAEGIHIISEAPLDFTFLTPHSFPKPILERIAAEFPALAFYCICIEEAYCSAGEGYFNPPDGGRAFEFVQPTDALYEKVHGEPPFSSDD